jgi:hypothetical protein
MNEEEKIWKLRILKTRMLKLRKLEVELKDHNETLFRKVRNTLLAIEREMLRLDPEQILIPQIQITEAELSNYQEPL